MEERNTRIGTDIDGVLSSKRFVKNKNDLSKAKRTELKLPKAKETFVISFRPERLTKETAEWLDENGVNHNGLYLPKTLSPYRDYRDLSREDQVLVQAWYKSSIINKLDLDLYLEDEELVREHLKRLTNALIVKPEKEDISHSLSLLEER